jgi:dCMP deaminase
MSAGTGRPVPMLPRPNRGEYLMSVAINVASRCNCKKTVVGAVLVREGRIAATGYNGTIREFGHCIDGACPRCSDPNAESGTQLDRCICVHAEANALLSAARMGTAVNRAECWVTTEPCLECTKLLIQARVAKVFYWRAYPLPRAESQELRTAMRVCAANATDANEKTSFQLWTPDSDLLGLEARYAEIVARLGAYVAARPAAVAESTVVRAVQ